MRGKMKNLVRQYLIEAETKLEAMQYRMDQCYPDCPPKFMVQEWNDLSDYCDRLKRELANESQT